MAWYYGFAIGLMISAVITALFIVWSAATYHD